MAAFMEKFISKRLRSQLDGYSRALLFFCCTTEDNRRAIARYIQSPQEGRQKSRRVERAVEAMERHDLHMLDDGAHASE